MSKMIEQVAKAIYADRYPVGYGPNWDEADEEERIVCYCYARAAIFSMRAPTLVMLEAGDKAIEDSGLFDFNDWVEAENAASIAWRAMIDEALRE